MSKREKERALEAYPDKKVNDVLLNYEEHRRLFQDGYEAAEKDLGWHSVDESLPPIDEEVIVLVAPLEVYSSPMKICFGHRPNPDGWDAISTLTGRKKHYTPETYDGWNIPGVRFWMPLPKLEEEK